MAGCEKPNSGKPAVVVRVCLVTKFQKVLLRPLYSLGIHTGPPRVPSNCVAGTPGGRVRAFGPSALSAPFSYWKSAVPWKLLVPPRVIAWAVPEVWNSAGAFT